MPVGVIANVLSVVLGGLAGSLIGGRLPDSMKKTLTTIFGICAFGMGISSVILMKNMPAVIFAVIVGTLIGCLLNLDKLVRKGTESVFRRLHMAQVEDPDLMIIAIVLFCVSGTGIYGSLVSGMTGDHSILLSKSILDFFTAMIFACRLKKSVMLIGIPQLVIFCLLFYGSRLILPLASDAMIADFKACGGFILLATGLSIMKIKEIPIINMVPAMLLVMPVSSLWMRMM
ncbi:MAG: DUF554 domain-containing protein [Firmicutes bacterium]|nr:DUF554 domain-containing protein [Bacillota bacterium]